MSGPDRICCASANVICAIAPTKISAACGAARSAARFKRPTKAFQDVLAAGGDGLRILALPGATPLEGGVPIVVDGKIIGAIGVSGVMSNQDAEVAMAGAAAAK